MSKQIPKQLVMFKRAPLLALLGLVLVVSVLSSLLLPPKHTAATTSSTLNFQARLLTAAGGLVPDGNYNVEFKLFDASSSSGSSQGACTGDSHCLWTETRTSTNQVRVTNGYLTVNLGSVTSFSSSINWDQQLWLSMNIGGTSGSPTWDGEMSPRLQLTAVPYAFRAGMLAAQNGSNLATLDFNAPSANRTIHLPDESGTVCIQSSVNCGFALSSGSGNYIQNGTSPQTANFNITGTGTAGTLQAATVDTPSGTTTLNIGTTNATSGINLNQSVTIASGKSLAVQGALTQSNGAVSLTGSTTSSINTTSGSLTLQSTNSSNNIIINSGTLSLNSTGTITVGSSNTSTVNIGALTNNARTVNVGTGTGGSQTQTVTIGSMGGASATTIQGGTGNITLQTNASGASIIAKSGTNTTHALDVQNSSSTAVVSVSTNPNNTNLVSNGSFEGLGTTGWSVKGSSSIFADSTQAVYGDKSLNVTTSATANDGAKFPVTLTAGQQYILTFYAKLASGSWSGFYFGYSQNGSTEDVASLSKTNQSVTTGGWTRFQLTFTPSSVTGAPYLYFKQGGATARTFYIDGVNLEAQSSSGLYDPYREGNIQLNTTITSPVAIQPASSTNAFDVIDASGAAALSVDTYNRRVGIGISQSLGATLEVLNASQNAPAMRVYSTTTTGSQDLLQVYNSALNSGNYVLQVNNSGAFTQRNATDSATAFQIQNSAGTSFFTVDNVNANITLNGGNAGQNAAWQTSANNIGSTNGLGNNTAAAANGYVYAMPGDDGTGNGKPYYAKLNADGSTSAWTQSSTAMNTAVANAVSVVVNGYVYVISGYNGSLVSTVQYAKLNADGTVGPWATTTSIPNVRQLSMGVAANGYIYIIGGADNSNTVNTIYYAKVNANGTIGSWATSANPLTGTGITAGRKSSSAVFANGCIYIIGGEDSSSVSGNVYFASVNASTGANSTWSTTSALPVALTGTSAVALNGYVYVMGGDTVSTIDTSNMVSTVYYAKINSNGTLGSWATSANALPAPIYGQSSAVFNGYIYTFGGWTTGRTKTNNVYYSSTGRILVNGSLDLVGATSTNMADGGQQTTSSTGGELTAGNTHIVGTLQVQNEASFNAGLNVNGNATVGGNLTIGPPAGDTTGELLVLGNKTDSGDPTGTAGAMYYNASSARFRCYEDGMWKNCVGFDSDNNRKYPFFSNDFVTYNSSATIYAPWQQGALSSATTSEVAGTAAHPGILEMTSSTTSNSGWLVLSRLNSPGGQSFLLAGGESFEAVFRAITTTNTTIRLGYLDTTSSGDASNGVYFNIAGTTLTGKVANNATRTSTGTSLTISTNTWYRAKVVVNSDLSGAVFTVYNDSGTQLFSSTLTATVPSTAGRETGSGFVATNSGTTAVGMADLDYMAMWWPNALGR